MRVSVEEAERGLYDVCIIGAGPGGIVLALEYQNLHPQGRVLLDYEYGKGRRRASRNKLDDTVKVVETKNHHEPPTNAPTRAWAAAPPPGAAVVSCMTRSTSCPEK